MTIETNKKCMKQFMTSAPSFTFNLPWPYGTRSPAGRRRWAFHNDSHTSTEGWLRTGPTTSWCTNWLAVRSIQCENLCARWSACRLQNATPYFYAKKITTAKMRAILLSLFCLLLSWVWQQGHWWLFNRSKGEKSVPFVLSWTNCTSSGLIRSLLIG